MLTTASLRSILAAAFGCAEDGVQPPLDALAAADLIPMGDNEAIDPWHVAVVLLAFLAYVPPAAVAAEAMRLAAFRAPALGGMTIGVLLMTAISSIRDGKTDSGAPYAITLRRGPQGERLAFDALTPRGVEGMIFMPPTDEPTPPASGWGALSVKVEIETRLSGLLLQHLAEQLGPSCRAQNDDNIGAAVGQEPAVVRPN